MRNLFLLGLALFTTEAFAANSFLLWDFSKLAERTPASDDTKEIKGRDLGKMVPKNIAENTCFFTVDKNASAGLLCGSRVVFAGKITGNNMEDALGSTQLVEEMNARGYQASLIIGDAASSKNGVFFQRLKQ